MNLFQVRPADAAGIDLDQQFTGSDLRNRHCLNAHIVDAAIDRSAHRCNFRVFKDVMGFQFD